MEDFNGDNQKLETALASLAAADAAEQQARTAQDAAIRREAAAAAEAVPLVKLLEVPVTQEAAQVDVDVSQIDFTQYTEVWIVPILSTAYHYIYLRCNNIATDSYFPSGHAPKLSVPPGGERPSGSKQAKIRLAAYLSPVACICENIYDTSNPPYYSTIPSIAPKDLKTLNFVADAGTINGEGKIILSGLENCNPKERPRTKVRGTFDSSGAGGEGTAHSPVRFLCQLGQSLCKSSQAVCPCREKLSDGCADRL